MTSLDHAMTAGMLEDRSSLLRGIFYGSLFAVPCWAVVLAAVYALI